MNEREILTLQFGHYSNFVGTHLWNIQEFTFDYNASTVSEINHDTFYREGLNNKGETTFTPRTLLVDLNGSLKTLAQESELYREDNFDPTQLNWPKELVEVRKEEPTQKNKFKQDLENLSDVSDIATRNYNLDKEVEVWSDFLYARHHPRSVNVIKEYQHNNTEVPFDVYPLGRALWNSEQFEEDFSDKIRQYIEECNSFQGFHVLLDATDAFSGLSVACIQHLCDEYERKSVLALPLIPPHYADYLYDTDEEHHKSIIKDSIRVLNTALCFNSLAEHSSLVVPMSTSSKGWRQPGPKREFNHVSYNHQLPYHSSAILASALDTFTLKYRLKSSSYSLNDLCSDLTPCGRKVAAASVCLPFSLNEDSFLLECLDDWEGPLSQCITPNCSIGTDKVIQLITLRGIAKERLKAPLQKAGKQKDVPAYKCNTVSDMLDFYLSCTTYGGINNATTIKKGLPVKTPFPRIFDNRVGVSGNILAGNRPDYAVVENVPVLAGLHSSSSLGAMLESLHTESSKIKFKRFHQFTNAGLDCDELSECLDKLFELRECYEDNYNI